MAREQWPIAFRRLPRLRWKTVQDQIVREEHWTDYPALSEDFAILDRELLPRFRELDDEALAAQNRFRREQLVLIVAGASAAVLGALQGMVDDPWPGLGEAAVAVVLGALGTRNRELAAQDHYRHNRVKAEQLRGEYFRFLGRVDDYADERIRIQRLKRRVVEIYREEELDEQP
jgi:hypothetical protein